MHIGQAIKTLRKKEGINQGNYAYRIGITQSYLSLIESGRKKPSMDVLETISEDLNTPLPILFWFGVEESDINPNKMEFFRTIKPSIDELITSIL